MSNPPLIWLTRPAPDSEALAAQLAQSGIESLIAQVLHIEPCAPQKITGAVDAILLTSRHASHALKTLPLLTHLPVFCVGEATAEAARAAGFSTIITGTGDVLELIPRILEQTPPGSRLLYLAGEETRIDVGALLEPRNIAVEKIITYKAYALNTLTTPLIDAISSGRISGISLFSPRSAMLATNLLTQHDLAPYAKNINAFCLSLAVADAAASLAWAAIHACAVPTSAAMHDLIVSRAARLVL